MVGDCPPLRNGWFHVSAASHRCTRSRGGCSDQKLAFEDAASAYRKALDLLDLCDEDARLRAELSIGLCRVLVRAGKRDEGRVGCRTAAELARTLGDPELLARAALELGSILVFANVDPELVALLREALSMLPPQDGSLRALVQARLAAAMQPASNPDEPITLAIDAIEMARRINNRKTLLAALRSGCSALVDLASPEVRLPLDREHASLAAAAGEQLDALRAHTRLIFDCFELGDRLGADAAVRAATALIEDIDHPSVAWRLPAIEAMRALWDGALEAALEACNRAAALGDVSGDPNARSTTLYQRQRILRMLGRVDELKSNTADMERLFHGTPIMEQYVRVYVAGYLLDVEDREIALRGLNREVLRHVLLLGDRTILEPLSQLALATKDQQLATGIRDRLSGVADQLVAGGVLGMTWDAPVHRLLALCMQTLGEPNRAVYHFRQGIALARRLGGEPVAIRMIIELGTLLASIGDIGEARALLSSGATGAASLSMALFAERAQTQLSALAMRSRPSEPGSAKEPKENFGFGTFSFVSEGDVWKIQRGSKEFRIRDSKGMQFIAALVTQPRQDIHVLDLTAPAARQLDSCAGGEQIDAAAQQAYKERIRTLRQELARAEEWNDSARADVVRTEMDALIAELSRGLGLGGKSRGFGSNAERARVNVQRRIRDAIRRVQAHDMALARHLDRSIRTGMHCIYDPE